MANGDQEKPKAPRPDERAPLSYPSDLMQQIRRSGLMRDTVGPVLGYPRGGIDTPAFVPAEDRSFLRGEYWPKGDSMKVYNVKTEPSQIVNTTVHEMAHGSPEDVTHEGYAGEGGIFDREEMTARNKASGLQYLRLMNEGVEREEALRIVRLHDPNVSNEFVEKAAAWWEKNIPTEEQLAKNQRVPRGKNEGYAEAVRRATEEIRGWQAEHAQRREDEPIAHPVAPDKESDPEWTRRKAPTDRHGLDEAYTDSIYAALGRDRRVKVRPGGGRRDSLTAFQNKYRPDPGVAEELYDATGAVGFPGARGLSPTELSFGMADAESDFRPSQVSDASARGLLQITDIAAEELGYDPQELRNDRSAQMRASLEYAKREIEESTSPEEGVGRYFWGRKGYREASPPKKYEYARKVFGRAFQKPE